MSSPKASAEAVADIAMRLATGGPEGLTVMDIVTESNHSESVVSLALRQMENEGRARRVKPDPSHLWFPVREGQ